MKKFNCAHCGKASLKETGHVNRSVATGCKLYCSMKCSGLGRRKNISSEQKKGAKRLYDLKYRAKNRERLCKEKMEFFRRDYAANPEKYRKWRKARSAAHSEYCRRPEYMAKKHTYDRIRYAKEKFGDMWESHVLIMGIEEEVLKHMSKYEIGLKNKTLNKAQTRRRNGTTKRSYA